MDIELQPSSPKKITNSNQNNKINIIDDSEYCITNNDSNNNIIDDFSKNTNTVIFGNKEPLKFNNDWMIKEVPETEPLESEKKLLEGTKSVKQLKK